MLKLGVNLKFHLNPFFIAKVMSKISLRTFGRKKICQEIGLSVTTI